MSHTAQLTQGAQEFHERMFPGYVSDYLRTDPEYIERFDNFAFDEVLAATPALDDRARMLCWLATLLGCQGIDEFRGIMNAALNMGVAPEAIQEVVYQGTAYLGMGRVFPFLKAKNEIFEAHGIELPLPDQATTTPDEKSRYQGGEEAQVAAIGEHMRGFANRGAADYPHIAQWLVKNCFGDYYTRGGLTMPEREMCTFCYIAAQGGCESQLKSHVAANVQCGNDRAFLIQVASNNLPFIGYPRTLNALAAIEEVTGAKE